MMRLGTIFLTAIVILLSGCTEAQESAQDESGAEPAVTQEGNVMQLPEPKLDSDKSVEAAINARRSRRVFQERAITTEQLSQVLWCAQGVTDARGLKAAPSAGATFPLELYAVVGNVQGLEPGLYRYDCESHTLERVKEGDLRAGLARAALSQQFIAKAPATVVIAAEYERTAGRYRGRAERYVHMEVGHVGQNVYLQCESLGLATCAVGAFDDAGVKELLGIKEEPLYILPVGYAK